MEFRTKMIRHHLLFHPKVQGMFTKSIRISWSQSYWHSLFRASKPTSRCNAWKGSWRTTMSESKTRPGWRMRQNIRVKTMGSHGKTDRKLQWNMMKRDETTFFILFFILFSSFVHPFFILVHPFFILFHPFSSFSTSTINKYLRQLQELFRSAHYRS